MTQTGQSLHRLKKHCEQGWIQAITCSLHRTSDIPLREVLRGFTDFVCYLDCTFHAAYGRDGLPAAIHNALFHGQLHEGLQYKIMQAPTVCSASSYKEPYIAAKNEKCCLEDLKKQQQYHRAPTKAPPTRPSKMREVKSTDPVAPKPSSVTASLKTNYNNCNQPGHIAQDCHSRRTESGGQLSKRSKGGAKQIQTQEWQNSRLHQWKAIPFTSWSRLQRTKYQSVSWCAK